jgi:hypothetical protein
MLTGFMGVTMGRAPVEEGWPGLVVREGEEDTADSEVSTDRDSETGALI